VQALCPAGSCVNGQCDVVGGKPSCTCNVGYKMNDNGECIVEGKNIYCLFFRFVSMDFGPVKKVLAHPVFFEKKLLAPLYIFQKKFLPSFFASKKTLRPPSPHLARSGIENILFTPFFWCLMFHSK
jgi:hypothetical protein